MSIKKINTRIKELSRAWGEAVPEKGLKISLHCLINNIFSQGVCVRVCVYISALLFCQKGVGHIFLYRYLSFVPASQEWGRRSIDLGEGDCSSGKRIGELVLFSIAWY